MGRALSPVDGGTVTACVFFYSFLFIGEWYVVRRNGNRRRHTHNRRRRTGYQLYRRKMKT